MPSYVFDELNDYEDIDIQIVVLCIQPYDWFVKIVSEDEVIRFPKVLSGMICIDLVLVNLPKWTQ